MQRHQDLYGRLQEHRVNRQQYTLQEGKCNQLRPGETLGDQAGGGSEDGNGADAAQGGAQGGAQGH